MSILQGHTGPTTRNFKANLEGRDFICGDIHGCYDDLMRQLNQADFTPQTDRVFSLGDLCDRGPKSLETLRLLNKPWFFAVMGNHEQMLFEFFRGALPLSTWSKMGGEWAGKLTSDEAAEVEQIIDEKVVNLPLSIRLDYGEFSVGLVHAEPYQNWDDIDAHIVYEEPRLWSRDRRRNDDETFIENIDLVFVGHCAHRFITRRGNVIYIDQGAGFPAGSLTVRELPELAQVMLASIEKDKPAM